MCEFEGGKIGCPNGVKQGGEGEIILLLNISGLLALHNLKCSPS